MATFQSCQARYHYSLLGRRSCLGFPEGRLLVHPDHFQVVIRQRILLQVLNFTLLKLAVKCLNLQEFP